MKQNSIIAPLFILEIKITKGVAMSEKGGP